METNCIKRVAFGLLRIDVKESNVNVNISNFMNGKSFEFSFDSNKFGNLQDFGLTLEHVFLLFVNNDAFHVIGFDSTKSALFECVQSTSDNWSRKDLPEINIKVEQIERKVPVEPNEFDDTQLQIENRNIFLATTMFKVYLVRNINDKAVIQRIFDAKNENVAISTRCDSPSHTIDQTVAKVCTGNDFLLMLTKNGQLYSMGTGTRGELGIQPLQAQCDEPKLIEDFVDADIQIVDISCGGWHSLALTSDQDVYAWGLNSDGQCGLSVEETKVLEIPHPIDLSRSAHKIQTQMKATFVRLDDGSTVVYGKS